LEAVAIVSIAAAVATILVLAGYLITLAIILRRVNSRLGTVIATLREVAAGTEPIEATVGALEVELRRVRGSLGRFAGAGETPRPSGAGPSGADGVIRS
jgi:hypothetical protein